MIEWNVSPEIFSIGFFSLKWYSLAFAISFLLGYYMMRKIVEHEKRPEAYADDIFLYVFIGTILGARLGHCLFYDPSFYLSHPVEILKIWHGGLASHGAAIGILISAYLFSKRRAKISYLWTLDRIVIMIALAASFIRLGNLFNSEIYGIETDLPWSFIFVRSDPEKLPRHPTQIYESIAYLVVFLVLYRTYWRNPGKVADGLLLGIFLVGVFGFRIIVEGLKENQELWENTIPLGLNMGQLLSVPLVIAGLWFIFNARRRNPAAAG